MLKRFDTVITQFDGTPWKDEKQRDLTLGHAIVSSLLGGYEDERALSGEDKLKRYILAERIYSTGSTPTEVTVENLALIKACVGKAYSTSVVGFIFTNLENGTGPSVGKDG